MELASTPAPSLPDRIGALRTQLASTLQGLAAGATTLREAKLDGDDWRDQLQAATRRSGAQWRAPYEMLRVVKAGAAELGSDPLAMAARTAIDGALAVANRGLDNMGRAYMQFWNAPAQHIAPRLTEYVANVSDHTSAAIVDAVAALDRLLAGDAPTA